MINLDGISTACRGWRESSPFPHFVVDDFFEADVASALEREFPAYDGAAWHGYENAIEVKKVCNNWNLFPETTYQVFSKLNSSNFVSFLSEMLFDGMELHSDDGLNGGGGMYIRAAAS